MEKLRKRLVPASYVMLINANNEVLLLRRFNTGYQDGMYMLPAGHLEPNETFTQAVVREAQEEVGVVIKSDDVEIVHVMNRLGPGEDNERIDVFFSASRWQSEPAIMEPDKCDDVRWFPLNNLPEAISPYIRHAIDCIAKKVYYSEDGF